MKIKNLEAMFIFMLFYLYQYTYIYHFVFPTLTMNGGLYVFDILLCSVLLEKRL